MEQGYARITVCFEAPFWIGVLEREWGGTLEVCKIVFGAEPRDYEVYVVLVSHWARRKAGQQLRGGVGTRAQQAIALQREQNKRERREDRRRRDEAEEARRFQLRRQKKKEKHRGR